jgi:hypothetical protein
MQATLHRHGADAKGAGDPSVAPALHHHPAQHLLATRIQASQESLHPAVGVIGVVLGLIGWTRQLFQQLWLQWGGPAQLAVAAQQPPLVQAHAQPPARLPLGPGRSLAPCCQLRLQPGQPGLQLALAAGQAHRRGVIAQVMEDRSTDVGPGKNWKGGLLAGAEQFRGPDQPKRTHLKQILPWLLAAPPVMPRQGGHQVAMGFH